MASRIFSPQRSDPMTAFLSFSLSRMPLFLTSSARRSA